VICERDINHPVAPADVLRKLDTLERRMRHLCAA
jgi:hypothetical protein